MIRLDYDLGGNNSIMKQYAITLMRQLDYQKIKLWIDSIMSLFDCECETIRLTKYLLMRWCDYETIRLWNDSIGKQLNDETIKLSNYSIVRQFYCERIWLWKD